MVIQFISCVTNLCLLTDANIGKKKSEGSFDLGPEPKHVIKAEAADPKTKKASTFATASGEMTMMSQVVFVDIYIYIWFVAMIVISHSVVY